MTELTMHHSEKDQEKLERITRALLREFRELEVKGASKGDKGKQKELIREKLEKEDL